MRTITFLACILTGIAYGQDTLSMVKSSRNVVTVEISDVYSPYIYLYDSVIGKSTISDIAALHKTGWTKSDIDRLTRMVSLRTSLNYINNSILKNDYTVRYQPYARDPVFYDWIELAYKNSKLRAPEMLKQIKKTNNSVTAAAVEPWVLIILDLSTGYTEAEIRKELKKRKIDRFCFDLRGKAIKPFGEDNSFGDDPMPPPPEPVKNREQDPPYTLVEVPASFPGGTAAMNAYISKNLVYPERALKEEIEGKAYVKFVVSKNGEISNVMIVKKVPDCPECDKEAVRLIKSMPKWTPAKHNGENVDSYFNYPVAFKLL